ncbi:hypothetical protein BX666DRAFT_543850 [Dichotomocladium elegans]|nr:hypothetical protein BX666DRAFT_543850 [Dichotomocladium elegans]
MRTGPLRTMWNYQPPLLALPKELLLEIVTNTAVSPNETYPKTLIELSKTCRYLYFLIHQDPRRLVSLWPRAFRARFDASAIYRRQLHRQLDWQAVLERRCRALETCRHTAAAASLAVVRPIASRQPRDLRLADRLDKIDWEVIWDMITEHDHLNIPLLLKHQVHLLAGAAFQSSAFRDREAYPMVLPILSLLVNYDFSITRFFSSDLAPHIVSQELSQFAYDFEADVLITKHMSPRLFHSEFPIQEEDDSQPPLIATKTSSLAPSNAFYPSQDPLTSAFHLFFTTIFALHPDLYQAIPRCTPIPLFPLNSRMFDVEFLRRYERQLFHASLRESREAWHDKLLQKQTFGVSQDTSATATRYMGNIYADTGFASSTHFVSEAHLIEGDWMGYYSFMDVDSDADEGADETVPTTSDWFDGPLRLTLRIVPLDDSPQEEGLQKQQQQQQQQAISYQFPDCHLRTCPLTRFEGTGVDDLGGFHVTGLIDDSEDGQVTWEKTYIESGETWEYSGRFLIPMGLCGRWGDEQYGGPWWIWKADSPPANAKS